MTRLPVVSLLVASGIFLAACGNSSATCTEVREPVDPQSFAHVVDPDSVTYGTDPPTSGPHLAVPAPTGPVEGPLARPLQVRILESGRALVQWEGVDSSTVAALESLAGPAVIVSRGEELPAPVVATSWTWKLSCHSLDVDALTDFVSTRTADAPGSD